MPAPTDSQIETHAASALKDAGIKGAAAQGMAKAMAKVTAHALSLLCAQANVLPGVPAAAPPPSGSGSTVGPGLLFMPVPIGQQLIPIARAAFEEQGIKGEYMEALAKVLAAALEIACLLFTLQIQVAPGIPIAGFVTTGPGGLV